MSFLLGVLFLVSGAQSQEPAATAPGAAQTPVGTPDAKTPEKNEKKICRREESTESRLGGKRICLTAEQWKRAGQGTR